MRQNVPFFVVGCPWSGIPLLRRALCLHPHLFATEPNFFYRWSEAYGSLAYEQHYLNNPDLRAQWLKDGFSREEIEAIFEASANRQNASNRYGNRLVKKHRSDGHGRWFDTTPENVYGLLLLRAQFPHSSIIHVYKHPFAVIASLMHSPSSRPPTLKQAVNQWLEAMQIISVFKKTTKSNLIEISFEAFVSTPSRVLNELLRKLGEDPHELSAQPDPVTAGDGYVTLLSEEDKAYIHKHCKRFMKLYGYDTEVLARSSAKSQTPQPRRSPAQPPRPIQAPPVIGSQGRNKRN